MTDLAERLRSARAELVARIEDLQSSYDAMVAASRDSNADDEHDPEGATIAFERAQLASVLQLTSSELGEVDAAIARLEIGTYGACERCGRRVAPARLEARPTARLCIACASSSAE